MSESENVLRKVPEITIGFWIIKLLSTAMGESTSDYLVFHMNPYIAVALCGVVLAGSLLLQILVRRFSVAIYWFAVVMVAVFGTMAADITHVVLGVPYPLSSAAFAAALAVVFALWHASEKTLSIHSIYTVRRELFYWATVMATFALGTAAGDMTAASLRLGYLASLVLFAVLFAAPLIARRLWGANEVASFWFAYVMTRPLGASFADWMGKGYLGGLGIGDGRVAVVLTLLIATAVGIAAAAAGRRTRAVEETPLIEIALP